MDINAPHYVTKDGLERLQLELQDLKNVKRREVAEKIDRAKELGDLSENGEYQDAKDELAFIEGHIQQLEHLLMHAEVISEAPAKKGGMVNVGSTVIAKANDREVTYQIVGSNEADPKQGKISNESPLGQAFLGKSVGDDVDVITPAGTTIYRVIKIQ